jgi:hypothetical protein
MELSSKGLQKMWFWDCKMPDWKFDVKNIPHWASIHVTVWSLSYFMSTQIQTAKTLNCVKNEQDFYHFFLQKCIFLKERTVLETWRGGGGCGHFWSYRRDQSRPWHRGSNNPYKGTAMHSGSNFIILLMVTSLNFDWSKIIGGIFTRRKIIWHSYYV